MTSSIKAYQEVCKALSIKPARIRQKLPIREDAILVILPNKILSHHNLFKLATAFGKEQPYPTYIWKAFYRKYTPEQLSGPVEGEKAYRWLYIPKTYNVPAGTLAQQAKTPGRVPSVLEAICFWFALRASGEELNFNSTYIRHFDLEPKKLDGWLGVPGSCVDGGGGAGLGGSDAGGGGEARVAVGSELEPLASTSTLESSDLPDTLTINGRRYIAQ